jgi:hypothetical protein
MSKSGPSGRAPAAAAASGFADRTTAELRRDLGHGLVAIDAPAPKSAADGPPATAPVLVAPSLGIGGAS